MQGQAEKDYGAFTVDLYRGLHGQRLPLQGTIDVTWQCNLACAHCYNRLPCHDPGSRTELTYEEHCRILDEITDAGCLWLLAHPPEVPWTDPQSWTGRAEVTLRLPLLLTTGNLKLARAAAKIDRG